MCIIGHSSVILIPLRKSAFESGPTARAVSSQKDDANAFDIVMRRRNLASCLDASATRGQKETEVQFGGVVIGTSNQELELTWGKECMYGWPIHFTPFIHQASPWPLDLRGKFAGGFQESRE